MRTVRERRGSRRTQATTRPRVSRLIRWKAQRQPNRPATHVPSGTPATEAIENPEKTHAMKRVRFLGEETCGANVMATATIAPATSATTMREAASIA